MSDLENRNTEYLELEVTQRIIKSNMPNIRRMKEKHSFLLEKMKKKIQYLSNNNKKAAAKNCIFTVLFCISAEVNEVVQEYLLTPLGKVRKSVELFFPSPEGLSCGVLLFSINLSPTVSKCKLTGRVLWAVLI